MDFTRKYPDARARLLDLADTSLTNAQAMCAIVNYYNNSTRKAATIHDATGVRFGGLLDAVMEQLKTIEANQRTSSYSNYPQQQDFSNLIRRESVDKGRSS
jgi:hypothetical protein